MEERASQVRDKKVSSCNKVNAKIGNLNTKNLLYIKFGNNLYPNNSDLAKNAGNKQLQRIIKHSIQVR
jgi:hypothetical protein